MIYEILYFKVNYIIFAILFYSLKSCLGNFLMTKGQKNDSFLNIAASLKRREKTLIYNIRIK